MPFRPRRGWGWPTLRSPGTNSWQQLCSQQQTAVGPSLLFSPPTLGYRLQRSAPLLPTVAPKAIKSDGFEKRSGRPKGGPSHHPHPSAVSRMSPRLTALTTFLKGENLWEPFPFKDIPLSPLRNLWNCEEISAN